ncbi:MAG TPA: thiamine pyrophosphate-dependent dehydrogenase E1 component subunit alpha [Aggregatilineales bacterium]|nr:thiamine pyrophosphate-dependent dehydrogenase E1 component subunit alpha [Aggregatilineales bacterium]
MNGATVETLSRAERLDTATRQHALQKMIEVRAVEGRIQELFLENVIRGTTHLCDGQEAVSAGMAAVIDAARGDTVTCTYRGHGHALALGMTIKTMMAEMMGKAAGCSKGKGGSMHLTDMHNGLIGTFAVVGAGLPIANGAALTAQLKKTGAVAVAIFGEGTSNIGTFHEALNMAGVWKLPTIFLCENNLYGEYSAYAETTPVPNVADRAAAYGMPGVIVDGQDVEKVYTAMKQAAERARSGQGPTLVEAKTYRYRGHSRTDPAPYRRPGELDEWLKRDPINILAERMIQDSEMTASDLDAMRQAADTTVDEAIHWAMEQPYPAADSIYEDIWV